MNKRAVQIIVRPSMQSRRRRLGLAASAALGFLRAPEPDETPLSRSEVRFGIRQGLIVPLPAVGSAKR